MGQTIWVDSEGRAADDLPADNSVMLRLNDQLSALSERLHVAKLSDFFDYSVLSREFGDDSTAESWFDPAGMLDTVVKLRQHLAEHTEDLAFTPSRGREHYRQTLTEELAECENALRKAVSQRRKARFLIVP